MARRGGLGERRQVVEELHLRLSDFIHRVVVHRKGGVYTVVAELVERGSTCSSFQVALAGLGSPCSFFCSVMLSSLPGGSGVLADPARIDEEFQKASLFLSLWAKGDQP